MKGSHYAQSVAPRSMSVAGIALPPLPGIAVCLLGVYVVTWFLQIGFRIGFFDTIRFELLLGALLGVICVGMSSIRDPRSSLPGGLICAAVLLLLVEAVQVPLSIVPAWSWSVFFERGIKFSLMGLFIAVIVRNPTDLRWFLMALIVACGYVLQESFRSAIDGSMIWQNQGVPRLHGGTKLFRHPNSLAGLAIGIMPFLYFLWPCVRHRLLKLGLIGLAGAAGGVLMYTGSRTGYVGFAAMIVMLLFRSKARKKALLLAPVVLTAILFALPPVYQARIMTMFTGEEIEGNSMGARTALARDAIEMFADRPFGIGVGAFPQARQIMFGEGQDTHNLYLEVATNLGIQGVIVFGIFIVLMLGALRRVARTATREMEKTPADTKAQSPPGAGGMSFEDWQLVRATALAASTYIYMRLVLGLFGHDLYEIYWWIGLGLAVCLSRIASVGVFGNGSRSEPVAGARRGSGHGVGPAGFAWRRADAQFRARRS